MNICTQTPTVAHYQYGIYKMQQCISHPSIPIMKSDLGLVLTVMNRKPIDERAPAREPISMAPQGWIIMSADVPTATPPANVAF